MPATVSHVLSATTPDDPAYEIRPSHWNSAHAFTFNAEGSEISGAFSNTPGGVTFGLETNGYITAGAPAGGGGITAINVSAGGASQNLSALTFNNGGGVSFGLAASVITASVATNYQSQGAYLTTAMASNASSVFAGVGETVTTTSGTDLALTVDTNGVRIAHPAWLTTAQPVGAYLTTARASNDAVGLNTALTAGPLAWTVNSSGISLNAGSAAGTTSGFGGNLISGSMTHNTAGLNLSLNHPAWLTTAMQSNAATLSNINISAGTTSTNASAFTFNNANGISFGLGTGASVGSITASHNGLTTAAASNHSHGNPQLNLTNLSGTTASNSAGFTLSLSAGNYLTTAAASDHSHGNPTLALTNLSGTTASNSAGFTLSLSAGAGGAGDGGNILAAGTRTAGSNSTLLFDNANGITFGLNAVNGSVMTASHNALTTARASNDAVGLNTAQTNVTWTVNSSGISINGAGYAGTGTTFAGANISASLTLNSVGLNGSFSVAAPGAAAENNWFNLTGNTTGNTTASGSTIALSGGNNITLSGTNGSVIRIDAPASSSLVAVSPLSISTTGSTISLSINQFSHSGFNPYADIEKLAGQYGQNSMFIDQVRAPNVVFDRVAIPLINTNSSNSSGSHSLSFWVGLYSRNVSTLSLVQSVSSSTALTHSGTAGSYSLYSGNRLFTIGMSNTLTEGDYWLAFVSRTTSGGANGSYSHLIASNIASVFLGHFGSSHNTTYQLTLGQGQYSATTTGIPGSIGFSQIRGSDSGARRAAFIMFPYGTI